MNPENFIEAYQSALGKQEWNAVEPLIAKNAVVTFSNGTVHRDIENVRLAYEHNFNLIKSEKYVMENIHWLIKEEAFAVYTFDFLWSGLMEGKHTSGNGIGTSVIFKEAGKWKLLAEHLGKKTPPVKK